MKLYVYCIAGQIDAAAAPITGIAGAKVDIVKLEGFSLLVSELEDEQAPVTRENALAHDSVIRSVLGQTTPLPFRFGTLATENELANYLGARRSTIESRLKFVSGCLEMSVKIISDTDRTHSDAQNTDLGPGAMFLEKKRREILGSKYAKEVSDWLQKEVGELAREVQVSLCPTEKLIVAAAHLVPREQLAAYRDRVGNARKLRPELHFLVSGPWPPYSFSNIDLEFKTRFGVS
ncbi:MAG TPA: GvpL/GvpF family gas vesicle protein [Pyrinomonadaceae bacterium]|nr:GvpL/GvpF family gas vesicle protein [Pyrinomonadaceae bacterium]